MAPNLSLDTLWRDSDENTSHEALDAPGAVPQVPELFSPHLPQHFQDPDSPNLHLQQQFERQSLLPATKPRPRSTLRAFVPPQTPPSSTSIPGGGGGGLAGGGSAAVDTPRGGGVPRPTPTPTPTPTNSGMRNLRFPGVTHLRGADGSVPGTTTDARDGKAVNFDVTNRPPVPSGSAPGGPEGARRPAILGSQGPTLPEGGSAPSPASILPKDTKEPSRSGGGAAAAAGGKPGPTASSPQAPSSTTTPLTINPGFKLPGHAPESPADLVLIHHERAIDVHNQTGLDGIIVRDDSTSLTPEGATALILVGTCSVFLVLICFIMFVQKVRKQRIERKVSQEVDVVKPPVSYDSTGMPPHPHPLSLIPPALLHALTHPTGVKGDLFDDHIQPSFLTMEPPQSLNSLGRLWFSICFDYVQQTLLLNILHARYSKGRGSTTNPGEVWVEACVLTPMNAVKASHKTGTRRASLAPVFNQKFIFKVADEEVTQFLVRMTLYDRHPQQGEKAVGSVIVPLSTVDLCSNETVSRDLQ
ncbi:uncharacterized protein LOC122247587 [Penaeus japonicus]|uniref:uncharacterized protein LOC122247587 n=1 Tax=Penaeus japonicus TaxID=27405 RepID=UPI001C71609A|nr:uncharacterized protein LOC122247587 [Penaeus japonicus]